ncbi:MAG: FAD-dependent oxidoreductase, partial [Caulobacteraceae bacterium]|nr:FAD-dependent oxidoreductase [Caulobacteraceae bacterium]
MSEEVVVLGAGMAGLAVALALVPTGRRVTLLERDPAPPDGVEAAFDHWRRRGATQLRHSHAFLARLRALIAREHPALLQALREAGARELTFADMLPSTLRDAYIPAPGDEDLAILISRRTTLETIMRHYVEARGAVIRSGVFADGLIGEKESDGAFLARGFRLQGGEAVTADLVVDAAGRGSPTIDWLDDAGVAVPEDREGCAILYYTRFYALRPGADEPRREEVQANGDLGYLKFGVFPADRRTFSITLAVPEVETGLRMGVVRPEAFEAIVAALPGVAPWTREGRADPVSRVFAMGDLESRWRDLAPGGRPLLRNGFLVGDSLARTNPLYGRGCSFAMIEAHLLRDVL